MNGLQVFSFSKGVAVVYAMAGSMLSRPHDVRSLSVSPGTVETPILKNFYESMSADILDRQKAQSGGRNALPEEIAKVIAFSLSADAVWLNGTDIVVDGGGGRCSTSTLSTSMPKMPRRPFSGRDSSRKLNPVVLDSG